MENEKEASVIISDIGSWFAFTTDVGFHLEDLKDTAAKIPFEDQQYAGLPRYWRASYYSSVAESLAIALHRPATAEVPERIQTIGERKRTECKQTNIYKLGQPASIALHISSSERSSGVSMNRRLSDMKAASWVISELTVSIMVFACLEVTILLWMDLLPRQRFGWSCLFG
ncbi:hypothetical protein ARMSODRAFT_978230 [Armillaria solidipes]|uniref:Uncharacterized protein n=1 Tax=Armillaria solidipes TaxID=1076256 RepID=A0A2H3BHA1_9AGAR|nr:hypothetical protein ARMSODRAFT_978230 [Armillaria solidipes]